MKININGKEVEAYHLIMRKENALAILNGKKKIEVRVFSKKYADLFIDKNKEAEYLEKTKAENFEYIDENGVAECDKIYNDTKYIYFTNYNKSWHLIVKIKAIFMLWFTDDDMIFLENDLGFKDMKDDYTQFKETHQEDDELPGIFAIELDEIIQHENLK